LRNLLGKQEVRSNAFVNIHLTGNAVVQQTKVETNVPGIILLPREFGVLKLGGEITCKAVINCSTVKSVGLIRRNTVVTGYTITEPEFEQADRSIQPLEELLVGNVPCGRSAPEGTPFIIGAKERRAVFTNGCLQEITVIVIVICDTEE